eukprot:TRINITY_DN8267_c0_g3_i1.p1 TRINITY_DN8267_c0_g3~~TRINITY_DN8267_c0_g3_i1.p1  ORF type:complete len:790 (-),score=102.97 TRINITY_DN8267_c0_g3_i1:6-2375(-)
MTVDDLHWVSDVRQFHTEWFVDPVVVQPFWFGAHKREHKARMEEMISKYEAVVMKVLEVNSVGLRASCFPLAPLTRPLERATARLRLSIAVFLDQMARNIIAVRGETPQTLNLRTACDSLAVPLALSTIADVGGLSSGTALMALGNPAELCFLSLVLRHTRQAGLIAASITMLEAIVDEMKQHGACNGLHCRNGMPQEEWISAASALLGRFLSESYNSQQALAVNAYLARALTTEEPILLKGPSKQSPRLEVLDARCRRIGTADDFFAALVGAQRSAYESHELVHTLRESLRALGFLSKDRGIVLSLSGGVDSMVTCCLLSILQLTLAPAERFQWCALHLRHPNRGDAEDEEAWVRIACDRLGVKLYTHALEVRRPHGDIKTGISRVDYECKTKEIRFRMYERCFAQLGVASEKGAALVAHHQDDVDENRLAELGKSNILNIDGMVASSMMLGVEVIRPLLAVRKAQLVAFADEVKACYMRDSTPLWSTRGWTRRTIDEYKAVNEAGHAQFLMDLSTGGAASERLGGELSSVLQSWRASAVCADTLKFEVVSKDVNGSKSAKAAKKKLNGNEAASKKPPVVVSTPWSVDIVELSLAGVFDVMEHFERQIRCLCDDVGKVAEVWNARIDAQLAKDPAQIVDSLPKGNTQGERDQSGEGDDGDGENGEPGVCHLRKVTAHGSGFDASAFYFSRAIYSACSASGELQRVLGDQPISLRALAHLWDSIKRARQDYLWCKPNKCCVGLYLVSARLLLLLSVQGYEEALSDARWQRAFAQAALERAAGVAREHTK